MNDSEKNECSSENSADSACDTKHTPANDPNRQQNGTPLNSPSPSFDEKWVPYCVSYGPLIENPRPIFYGPPPGPDFRRMNVELSRYEKNVKLMFTPPFIKGSKNEQGKNLLRLPPAKKAAAVVNGKETALTKIVEE